MPWYSPGSYGGTDFSTSPFVTDFLDQEVPRGVYQQFLTKQGLGGLDRRSLWAQNQYGNTNTGYQAAVRERPDLSYLDYLGTQFGSSGMNNIWSGLAPEQRGEQPNRWSPQTRFIPWG